MAPGRKKKAPKFDPFKTLEDALSYLISSGCHPGMYWRGNVWRVHVNIAGNFWDDNKDPLKAINGAIRLWEAKGCPMDGRAATV